MHLLLRNRAAVLLLFLLLPSLAEGWGFFAHKRINRLAVFTLPPQMIQLYKAELDYITEHATDPDKLRYVFPEEEFHHFIDLDRYGSYPYPDLPRRRDSAQRRYGADSLLHNGTVPWYAQRIFYRLTDAFRKKDKAHILKWSAYLGHYVADACVPLHAHSNYNGQQTGQEGIHALWESRIPELLADRSFDYWTGKAVYIGNPQRYIWSLVMESGRAADTVLKTEKSLSARFSADRRYAFLNRGGGMMRSYSPAYVRAYNQRLEGMVERRMRRAIQAVASLWYTAWVNAGQPALDTLAPRSLSPAEAEQLKLLGEKWHQATPAGRTHE
ncbi:zinc dependent phospholipase C family protein [Compostibacter hankyongensis]|uniref:S1/P1 Nuclease n=1 Tax=Compostibacter hankyongensis TaxID=1007089 RepID=A0ABP8FG37_9BACT